MRHIAIASILTLTAACHDCPTTPDDGPDDSSSSSAGESESSTGEVDCATMFHACWDGDVEFELCLADLFECDPDAEVYYQVCLEQILACTWACCPYATGTVQWSNNCTNDVIHACKDECGLSTDCLP